MKGTCGALRSERLDMEPAQSSHAAETYEHLQHEAMWTHFPHLRPASADELSMTYARRERGAPDAGERWENWILRDRATGAAVGDLQATISCDERTATIAYGVFVPFRGRGYAREAADALLTHLRVTHGIERARAEISAKNEPSLRIIRALGFECVETRQSQDPDERAGVECVFERRLG